MAIQHLYIHQTTHGIRSQSKTKRLKEARFTNRQAIGVVAIKVTGHNGAFKMTASVAICREGDEFSKKTGRNAARGKLAKPAFIQDLTDIDQMKDIGVGVQLIAHIDKMLGHGDRQLGIKDAVTTLNAIETVTATLMKKAQDEAPF